MKKITLVMASIFLSTTAVAQSLELTDCEKLQGRPAITACMKKAVIVAKADYKLASAVALKDAQELDKVSSKKIAARSFKKSQDAYSKLFE